MKRNKKLDKKKSREMKGKEKGNIFKFFRN